MAQILKYKQGVTTCVTLTTYSTILSVVYKPRSKECHAVSMCSAVDVAEIFTSMITCVLVCVCLSICIHVSGGPENDVWVYCSCVFCASWIYRCSC